ncbi:MAG: Sau3AI family type II restriction endonuclease [Candidatus Falkowbacteria bacterium]
MSKVYNTKDEVFTDVLSFMDKHLRDVMDSESIRIAEQKIEEQGSSRKGYLGNLVDEYVFGQKANNRHEADLKEVGIELKTTPIKEHKTKGYIAKERLVFSMIDYKTIIDENWEQSSFLDKNKFVLLMFYLYQKDLSILDYEFKFFYGLDFLNNISNKDALQIKKDWEYIVDKIKKGEAHLLSEAETFYLGACTKASDSSKRRSQPNSEISAKPRAFSLKQSYLNYIVQNVSGFDDDSKTISDGKNTIDSIIENKLRKFVGMSDDEIINDIGVVISKDPKQYKRALANYMVSNSNRKIAEFEKANITMKVITLEHNGKLKESISFPCFDFKKIVEQKWEDSNFYNLLEKNRFLFIVFRKDEEGESIHFESFKFWNFPVAHMIYAKSVFDETKKVINSGKIIKEIKKDKNGKEKRYTYFPNSKFNGVTHVRPHGKNSLDVIELPVADELTGKDVYTKHCFWLNADYIRKSLEN